MSFEGVFARERLVAVMARERLYCEMNALVSLEVMVAVEALNALVAFERSVLQRETVRVGGHFVWWNGMRWRSQADVMWWHTSDTALVYG